MADEIDATVRWLKMGPSWSDVGDRLRRLLDNARREERKRFGAEAVKRMPTETDSRSRFDAFEAWLGSGGDE